MLYLITAEGKRLGDIAAARELLEEEYGAVSHGIALFRGIHIESPREIAPEDVEVLGIIKIR